jgi:hypothetical protein
LQKADSTDLHFPFSTPLCALCDLCGRPVPGRFDFDTDTDFDFDFDFDLRIKRGWSHKEMVTPGGLEPPTRGLGNRCSIHLSYGAGDGL